jgi:Transposase DDE domain
VKANASRHKAMSYGHMVKAEAELKAQIAALMNRAKAADQAEKNEPQPDVPAEIARRQDRLRAIQAARAHLEQRQRESELERGRDPDEPPRGGRYKRPFGVPEDKAQENFTDPDSRIMKRSGGGFDASYNAQTAVDEQAHIIVAAELTNCGSDAGELPGMLAAVKSNVGQAPGQVLADTGYRSEAVFEQLAGGQSEVIVSMGREGKKQLTFHADRKPYSAQMASKLKSPEGQRAYRKRKWIAEPPNGWIKSVLGFRQFSLRGLHRVTAEWKLVCMALNLRRMCTLQAA